MEQEKNKFKMFENRFVLARQLNECFYVLISVDFTEPWRHFRIIFLVVVEYIDGDDTCSNYNYSFWLVIITFIFVFLRLRLLLLMIFIEFN